MVGSERGHTWAILWCELPASVGLRRALAGCPRRDRGAPRVRHGGLAQDRAAPVRYVVVADGSEVRYRVREQLVGLSFPNDAVGATSAVEGVIAFDAQGRLPPGDSRFTVDLRTLRSDEARRDNYLRRNTLETDRYPTVTFVPTEARRLPIPFPRSGSVPFELVGDLTVKEATRRGHAGTPRPPSTGRGSPSGPGPRSASATSDCACPSGLRGAERGGRHQARGRSRPAPGHLTHGQPRIAIP